MGLFEKKYCSICGKEIKLLGDRKLEDGHCCKDCVRKLSPFFTGRKKSTVEEIKKQIAYREKNYNDLLTFTCTKVVGKYNKFYFDEARKAVCISHASNFKSDNADIIPLVNIYQTNITIKEEKEELYETDDQGNEISYNPPKFEYEYKFNVELLLNNSPYFEKINIDLNNETIDSPQSELFNEYMEICQDIYHSITGKDFKYDLSTLEYFVDNNISLVQQPIDQETDPNVWYCTNCGTKNTGNFCGKCGQRKPLTDRFCTNCGNKITDAEINFCPKCGTKLS